MTTDLAGITRSAEISDCGSYRFDLRRTWGEGPKVAWLMLNPSTADAEHDDPTLRRIQDWASRWGYHGVIVVNVFPFRASKPAELWHWLHGAPAEPGMQATNNSYIAAAAREAALRLVGFGADVGTIAPDDLNIALRHYGAEGLMCLGTSQHGWPLHPMARGKNRVPEYATPRFWQRPSSSPEPTP